MTFKENEPGYYTVKLFEEIVDFDKDQYGNQWYNVLFDGDAETFMWLKKEPPVEGQKYYGHIEKTKSGKRLRFKTDKLPETTPVKSGWQPKNETQVTRNMVWKNLLQQFDVQNMLPDSEQWPVFWGLVDLHTEMLLPKSPDAVKEPQPKATTSLGDTFRQKRAVSANDELPEGLFGE